LTDTTGLRIAFIIVLLRVQRVGALTLDNCGGGIYYTFHIYLRNNIKTALYLSYRLLRGGDKTEGEFISLIGVTREDINDQR
jgi:hypothetical protein